MANFGKETIIETFFDNAGSQGEALTHTFYSEENGRGYKSSYNHPTIHQYAALMGPIANSGEIALCDSSICAG